MHVDGVEPLHFHLDEMWILVCASDDVPAFHPVFPVYDAQEWREDISYELVFHDIAVQVEGVHARVEIDGQFSVVRIQVTNRNQLFGAFPHEPQHGRQFRSKFDKGSTIQFHLDLLGVFIERQLDVPLSQFVHHLVHGQKEFFQIVVVAGRNVKRLDVAE